MDTSVRYVRSRDGTRIAYRVYGDGPARLHLQVPSASHVELYPQVPDVQGYLDRLGRGRTLVRLDFRGTGMSDRDYSDHSPEALTADAAAVVDDLGIKQFDVVASGIRFAPAMGLALSRPESVSRMVLGYPFTARPVSHGEPLEPGVLDLMESNWDLYLEHTTQRNTRRPVGEIGDVLAFVRRCMDQRNQVAEARASRYEEFWERAKEIAIPVLVLEFVGNVRVPAGRVEEFAGRFPKGRFMALPEAGLTPPYGDGEPFLQAVEEFFGPASSAGAAMVPAGESLTPREREVIRLLAAGRTQPEIATELVISSATVSRHVVSVYSKIGAHRRAEAVGWAIRNGFA